MLQSALLIGEGPSGNRNSRVGQGQEKFWVRIYENKAPMLGVLMRTYQGDPSDAKIL